MPRTLVFGAWVLYCQTLAPLLISNPKIAPLLVIAITLSPLIKAGAKLEEPSSAVQRGAPVRASSAIILPERVPMTATLP